MTVINHKSISGITSITAPAGSDDLLTVHTNDTTERFRIVDSGAIVTGVTTASNFKTGTSNLHNVGVEVAGINVLGADTPIGTGATIYDAGGAVFTGVVTATSFRGDGSQLTGISSPVTVDSYHNVFGGTDAGTSLNSSSNNNVLFGQDAGDSITSGYENVCIGLRAGQALTDTRRNTCLGSDAGRNFGAGDSTFIGWNAGSAAASNGNVCIGHNAGTEANGNDTAVGYSCGPTGNYSGGTNVCYGRVAGNGLRSGASYNTIIGPGAGKNAATGQVNIEGDSNIIIGHEASLSSTTVDNECVIGALEGNSKAITNFRIPGTKFAANTTGVLIGTTTAGFAAYGDTLTIENSNHVGLTLRTATNKDAAIYFADSSSGGGRYAGIINYSHSNDELVFSTGTSERVRITASGIITKYDTRNVSIRNASGSTRGHLQANGNGIDLQSHVNSSGFITFSTNGGGTPAERLRIDSSGRLLIGDDTNRLVWGINPSLQVTGTEWDDTCVAIHNFGNNTRRPTLLFTKGKSGTIGNFGTAPAAGEGLGIIGWAAHDTTDAENLAAYIQCISTSQATANNQYGALTFTTCNGNTSAERLRIDSTGDVRFSGTNLTDNTNKNVNLTAPSYDIDEEDVNLVQVENETGMNQISFGGGTSGLNAATSLRFLTAAAVNTTTGTERLRIDNNGDLGLGIAAVPQDSGAKTLHIHHPTSGSPARAHLRLTTGTSGSTASNGALLGLDYSNNLYLYNHENGDLRIGTNDTRRITIDNSGRVIINRAGNDFALESNDAAMHINTPTDGGQGGLYVRCRGQGGGTASPHYGVKIDALSCANNANLQAGILIDLNQQYTQSGTGILSDVYGSYNTTKCFDGILRKQLGAFTNGYTYYSNIIPTASGGSAFHFRGDNNGSQRINIDLGGNVKNTNNSYGSLSDIKLKQNIVDANSQWDDIKAVKVRNFEFKHDPGVKLLGVVAQEIETISAGLVDTENDITMDDATGEGTVTGTTKSVKYSVLYMKSIKALQEAMARIETLEAEVAALKGS